MATGGPDSRSTFDVLVKLLMIGDSGVGKTCLLLRNADDSFSPTFITTVGIDFKIKVVPIDNTVVKLQIWDAAGHERFRAITASYVRGAHGILLVYDVTDRGSFDNVSAWLSHVDHHANIHVTKVLIGNKCDADPAKIQVTAAEGQALADKLGIKFFLTSAKNNVRVSDAFETVVRDVKNLLLTGGGAGKPGAGAKPPGGQGGAAVDPSKHAAPAQGGGATA